MSCIWYVGFALLWVKIINENYFEVTLVVMMCGILLGIECSLGILLGATMGVFFISYSGIIKGTSLENARIFNEGNNSNLILKIDELLDIN